MKHHDRLWEACQSLNEDYDPWGKNVRWDDPARAYPDCSSGCRHYYVLEDRDDQLISMDWGVCANPQSHRKGLLTFEHQGCERYEAEADDRARTEG